MSWRTPRTWLRSVLPISTARHAGTASTFLNGVDDGPPSRAIEAIAKEQLSAAQRLGEYLDEIREETRNQIGPGARALHTGTVAALNAVGGLMDRLSNRGLDPARSLELSRLAERNELLRSLSDAVCELTDTIRRAGRSGSLDSLTANMLGRVYIAQGLPDRAVEELERARALLGPRPDVVTSTAYVLARAGRKREALATIDELRRISKPRDPAPFRIAYVHIGLGDTERAFEWLLKAIEAHDWQMAMLKVEPAFDDLRSDPRFPALVERVGLPR